SWKPLRNLFSAGQLMNASFDRFHLVNAYGAFGSMTERRYEVIIEGTLAADPDAADEEEWLPFEFKGTPGDVRRGARPRPPRRRGWQRGSCPVRAGLPRGAPPLRRLRGAVACGGAPAPGIRVRRFEHRYDSGPERRDAGAWCTRTEAGELARL